MLKTIAAMLGKPTTNPKESDTDDGSDAFMNAIAVPPPKDATLEELYLERHRVGDTKGAAALWNQIQHAKYNQERYANMAITPPNYGAQTNAVNTLFGYNVGIGQDKSATTGNVTLHTTVTFNQIATALTAIKSNWSLSEDVQTMSDEGMLSLWVAKYKNGMVRPFANVDPIPSACSEDERMMFGITLFLMMRGYVERHDDFKNDAQIYKLTHRGEVLMYGDS